MIADLVGDNVGDCAGRGADLFESTAAENIGAMILAAAMAIKVPNASPVWILGVMMFPLVARAFGILASIIGIMSVKVKGDEDPMSSLNRGYYVAVVLAMVAFAGASQMAALQRCSSPGLVALLPLRSHRRGHLRGLCFHNPVLYRI